MNIHTIETLIKAQQKVEVSLKSGSVVSKVIFTRSNGCGIVEMKQCERGCEDSYYVCDAVDVEVLQCSDPFDELFK